MAKFNKIKKRDGKIVSFKPDKIIEAIAKAGVATGEFRQKRAAHLAEKVIQTAENTISTRIPSVEQIQDVVEQVLMESAFKKTAKAYIEYRAERERIRSKKTKLMQIYQTISHADSSEDSDVKRSNANVDGNSAMGKNASIRRRRLKRIRPNLSRYSRICTSSWQWRNPHSRSRLFSHWHTHLLPNRPA